MATPKPRRYFDANVIIRFLENGDGSDDVRLLLEEAANGKFVIVVSAITLIEVSREMRRPNDTVRWAKMMDFFEHEFLFVRDFDRLLGNETQLLLQDYAWLQHMDAAHLASSIDTSCECFYTFDGDLIRKFDGERGITIRLPGEPLRDEPMEELPLFQNLIAPDDETYTRID